MVEVQIMVLQYKNYKQPYTEIVVEILRTIS